MPQQQNACRHRHETIRHARSIRLRLDGRRRREGESVGVVFPPPPPHPHQSLFQRHSSDEHVRTTALPTSSPLSNASSSSRRSRPASSAHPCICSAVLSMSKKPPCSLYTRCAEGERPSSPSSAHPDETCMGTRALRVFFRCEKNAERARKVKNGGRRRGKALSPAPSPFRSGRISTVIPGVRSRIRTSGAGRCRAVWTGDAGSRQGCQGTSR